jgi:hypothetical protein
VPAVALVSVVVSSAFPLLQRRSNNEGTLYFSVVQQSLLNPGAMNGLKVFFLFPAELGRCFGARAAEQNILRRLWKLEDVTAVLLLSSRACPGLCLGRSSPLFSRPLQRQTNFGDALYLLSLAWAPAEFGG